MPVLLHGGLDEVGGRHLPDEVHQSVGGRHVAGVQRLVPLQIHALHVSDFGDLRDTCHVTAAALSCT